MAQRLRGLPIPVPEPVMHFTTPDASWKLAGGEASNASENHRIIAKTTSTPAGGAGLVGYSMARTDPVPRAPCRGAFLSSTGSGGCRSLRSLHHRLERFKKSCSRLCGAAMWCGQSVGTLRRGAKEGSTPSRRLRPSCLADRIVGSTFCVRRQRKRPCYLLNCSNFRCPSGTWRQYPGVWAG
jgi:hypothetical protein